MKSYRKELFFNLPTRRGLRNITREVQAAIDESGFFVKSWGKRRAIAKSSP